MSMPALLTGCSHEETMHILTNLHIDCKLGLDFRAIQPDQGGSGAHTDHDFMLPIGLADPALSPTGFMQDYDSEMHESFFRKRKRKNEVRNSEYEQ